MTPGEALQQLADLLEDAGVSVSLNPGEDDPPVVVLFSDGGDMRDTMRDGSARWTFRAVCLSGGWEHASAATMLADTVAAVAGAIWAAPAWTLDRVSGDRALVIGGANRLAADVFATTTVQL